MDIVDMERLGIDRLEAYQQRLVALHRELIETAAAAGKYEATGRTFVKILRLQADNELLPIPEAYEVIFGQLNAIPSKVLGIA